VLVDRSVEANNDCEEGGALDSDAKLARAKDVEIVETLQGRAAIEKREEERGRRGERNR
jgi:hypothetical protein